MSERIYSDIRGEIITLESGSKELWLFDWNGNKYTPNLILPNQFAMEKLRNYIDKKLKEMIKWEKKK